jgi:hypothetical protein
VPWSDGLIMTYTELFTAVKNYLQNDFPANTWTNVAGTGTLTSSGTEQINTFITQAEERIYNTVQIPPLRKNVTGLTTSGNKYLSCPADFMSVFSMAVIENLGTATENYTYLLNKDVNFIRASYPNSTSTGLPEYYALFGPTVVTNTITDELSFILGPTPDAAYSVELHYYAYPESITVAADGRTWLGDNYSPVLLYGTMVEAYIFLKGEQDLMAVYEGKYKEAMAQLNRLGTGLERNDAYRVGQASMKVNP